MPEVKKRPFSWRWFEENVAPTLVNKELTAGVERLRRQSKAGPLNDYILESERRLFFQTKHPGGRV